MSKGVNVYTTDFTIEDFDKAVRTLNSQGMNERPVFWLVGSEEQAKTQWLKFHNAMCLLIERYINATKKQK